MKAVAIIAAIICAWISGVGSSSAANQYASDRPTNTSLGSIIFLVFAAMCGLWAWSL